MSKYYLLILTLVINFQLSAITSTKKHHHHPKTIIVVGTQFGDEGKGKFTDLLGENAAAVVRAQGGSNAGHTILVDDTELKLHLIPSGIIHQNVKCYIGADCVINPEKFFEELDGLKSKGIQFDGRLWISPYAQVLFPYHIVLDNLEEERRGEHKIGTTGQGIGPCYQDKASRNGIRVIDLLNVDRFTRLVGYRIDEINNQLVNLYEKPAIDKRDVINKYLAYAEDLRPYVNKVEDMIGEHAKQNDLIIIEGAQASLLDNTYGFYPKVTSSFTSPAGIMHGTGLSPSINTHVLGITKAYMTMCGTGVLPTETLGQDLFLDNESGREVGVTDGKNRRIGWFDIPLTRLGIKLANADTIALTKLDIFDNLDEIKVCTHYRDKNRKNYREVSELDFHLKDIEPVYMIFPGWKTDISGVKTFDELPEEAKNYVRALEAFLNIPIVYISVGPDRTQTIKVREFP